MARSGCRSIRDVPWAGKKAFWGSAKHNKTIEGMGWGYQNPPFLLMSWKAKFWGAIVGASCLEGTVETVWTGPMAQ